MESILKGIETDFPNDTDRAKYRLEAQQIGAAIDFTSDPRLVNYTEPDERDAPGLIRNALIIHQFMADNLTTLDRDNLLETPAIPKEQLALYAPHWEVLASKGNALASALNWQQNPSPDSLKPVVEGNGLVLELFCQQMAQGVRLEQSAVDFRAYLTFLHGFRSGVLLWQQTGERKWLEKAYRFYHFAKNHRLFVRHLQDESLKNEAARQLGDSIRSENALVEDLEAKDYLGNFDQIARHYSRIHAWHMEQDRLLEPVRKAAVEKFLAEEVSENLLAFLQSQLRPEEAILELWPAELAPNAHGALLITADTLVFRKFDLPDDELEALSQQYREAITGRRADYQQLSDQLYQAIIAPFEPELEAMQQVYLVPNRYLRTLPFDAFRDGKGELLLKKYALSYHFNARLLFRYFQLPDQELKIYGFAPFAQLGPLSDSLVQYTLPDAFRGLVMRGGYTRAEDSLLASVELPATRLEVLEATKAGTDGLSFLDASATEKAFKESASGAHILHLATHAIVEEEQPQNSRLLFRTDLQSKEDGDLHFYELPHLNLKAYLVVLSACQTGVGIQSQPTNFKYSPSKYRYPDLPSENLAYGFAMAGIHNVMLSYWDLSDEPSSYLMQRFYTHLKNGIPMASSLRQAKLDYLNNPKISPSLKHPFYWAGYQFYGQNQPISPTGFSGKVYLIITLGGFVLAAGLFWVYRPYRKKRLP